VRQHFTGYEADGETGLNFAQARYHSPVQGRFTSVDPLMASADILNPESFNRYSYVQNDPLNAVDPDGLSLQDIGVLQTSDPFEAQSAQDMALRKFQISINDDYAARNGGTVGYSGRNATFSRLPTGSVVATVTIHGNFEDAFGNPNYGAMRDALWGIAFSGGNRFSGPEAGSSSSGWNAPLTGIGLITGAGEFSNEAFGYWRAPGYGFYPKTFNGNGSTGGKLAVLSRARAFKLFGRVAFFVGFANTVSQLHSGNISRARAVYDTGFGALGTFGGPFGFGANVIYTGVDMTVGWPAVGDAYHRTLGCHTADCVERSQYATFANK